MNEKFYRGSHGVEIHRRAVLFRFGIDLHNGNGDTVWGDVHTDFDPGFHDDNIDVRGIFTVLYIQ